MCYIGLAVVEPKRSPIGLLSWVSRAALGWRLKRSTILSLLAGPQITVVSRRMFDCWMHRERNGLVLGIDRRHRSPRNQRQYCRVRRGSGGSLCLFPVSSRKPRVHEGRKPPWWWRYLIRCRWNRRLPLLRNGGRVGGLLCGRRAATVRRECMAEVGEEV
jgi:hypothetical protein